MSNKMKSFAISAGSFILMALLYEYKVYLWAQNEMGPIIRVDIFIVYPLIIMLSVAVYFVSLKILK